MIAMKHYYNHEHLYTRLHHRYSRDHLQSLIILALLLAMQILLYCHHLRHEEGTEAINLEVRNSIDIVKVEITKKTVEKIRETFPNVYEKAMKLLQVKEYKDGIDAIAIPLNEPVPNWVLPFVKYYEIINDNIGLFPLESVGLFRGGNTNNYTNIIQF